MTDRSTTTPPPEDRQPSANSATTLQRGLIVSTVIHAVGVAWVLGVFAPKLPRDLIANEVANASAPIDVEIAPPPPKVHAPATEAPSPAPPRVEEIPTPKSPRHPDEAATVAEVRDAGVDATPDAREKISRRVRSATDAGAVALADGGVGDDAISSSDANGGQTTTAVAAASAGTASGSRLESVSGADAGAVSDAGSGERAVVQTGPSDPTVAFDSRTDTATAADATSVSPDAAALTTFTGTAANLFAYLPPGQVVTALIRFDRLRGTEWAAAAEALLAPMPDYRALFAGRGAKISSKIDMLTISSARPRDATATTLVMKTHLSRGEVRSLLANSATPIDWSAAGGGLVGRRGPASSEQQVRNANDPRVLLSPWQHWYMLAAPTDLSGLLDPANAELDTVEAKAKLPPWLASVRAIERESGTDSRGPALVVTLGRPRSGGDSSASGSSRAPAPLRRSNSGRVALPAIGLGVSSLPMPVRASIAMELVKQGWLVRGTMRFATEAEASEFVQSVRDIQHRVLDSLVLSTIVARQHGRNALEGLSLLQSGSGVSYATSLSIADARAVLAAIATQLVQYFGPL